MLIRHIVWILCVAAWTGCSSQTAIVNSLPRDAKSLADLLNDYRIKNGLPPIRSSVSLTRVATAHVTDLQNHFEKGKLCNLHSWSSHGSWTPCCYTGEQVQCMWNKPREITKYKADGYEITVSAFTTARPDAMTPWLAVDRWAHSDPHRAVILNEGQWANFPWKAMGAAESDNYASAWFGQEAD